MFSALKKVNYTICKNESSPSEKKVTLLRKLLKLYWEILYASESDGSLEANNNNEDVISDTPGVLDREPIMDNNESEVEVLEEYESSEYKDDEDISDEDNVDANEVPVKVDFDQGWKKEGRYKLL